MLDIKLIRETPDIVKKGIARKGADTKLVDAVLEIDKKRRSIIQEVEVLRQK